ncbi:MAG: type II toxin-antitoxin system RelE/ParE family toxin [Thiotrichaceae bacterium]|nr:type II toxin-antitoxin system RelE/ParE family toxin [Thiotrichaceae bacterium]PCI11174.1 MAG: plasmid maintenance system killer [Thiotrichales bacterium]PCI12902.1 MAG: plasmid maintenance system killer [Thiotrichales bacterium]
MIKSFSSKMTAATFKGLHAKALPPAIRQRASEKLRLLNAATTIEDLRVPPANYLEALKGDRKGQHSLRINKQWRLCFKFKQGDAYDVEITDYH